MNENDDMTKIIEEIVCTMLVSLCVFCKAVQTALTTPRGLPNIYLRTHKIIELYYSVLYSVSIVLYYYYFPQGNYG